MKSLDPMNKNFNQILNEYDNQCTLYSEFTTCISSLFCDLLKQYNIRVHSVTPRLKERSSLELKLTKSGRNYTTLKDITDISGIRVITYYPDEVDSVSSLIYNEFKVDPKHSIDKRLLIDSDRFGYISVHYIVKLSPSRLLLTEYRRFSECQAEIQVRSILQHAWAEIEHDLGYKNQEVVPRQIKRRFARLAGLLELADDEFTNIRNQISTEENKLAEMIQKTPRKVPINLHTILVYLKSSQLIKKINSDIERATHNVLADSTNMDPLLKDTSRRLRYLGLKNIADIDTALTTHRRLIVSIAKSMVVPAGVEEGYYAKELSLFYLCYALLASEGSPKNIDAFITRYTGTSDEELKKLLLKFNKNLKK